MNLTLFFDHRFYLHADGSVRSLTHYNYPLFSRRYLQVFDEVKIVTRLFPAEPSVQVEIGREYEMGPGLSIVPLDSVGGFRGFVGNRRRIAGIIKKYLARADAIMMVAPGAVASMTYSQLRGTGRPYGMEVVSDPYDVFAPGTTRVPLRALWHWLAPRQQRAQCANAATVSYVTASTIQQRYPPAAGAFTTNYSSIELATEAFIPAIPAEPAAPPWHLVTIGSMAQPYKGFDVLLRAVRRCRDAGLDVALTLVGDGHYRAELEALSQELKIDSHVHFIGRLAPGQAVRDEIDRAHLFVLPSRVEGLPRVIIEAMARGKACIGSRIGGIPELVPEEGLFTPGDDSALADKITEVLTDGALRTRLAERNYREASEYNADLLDARRLEHYKALRDITLNWKKTRG
jgi:glycosyltransferase involved in cell wall biosynthesis